MRQLVLSTKNVVAQNIGCQIQVGLLEDNGYLTNITDEPDLEITVKEGNAKVFTDNGLYLQVSSLRTVILRLDYDKTVNFVSLWCFPQASYPGIYDIINVMQKYLPENLYNLSPETGVAYDRNFAIGAVFDDLSEEILNNFYNIYPPFTGDTSWEKELNNGYPWTNSIHYKLVIQNANNLGLFSANLYDTSFLISRYIYARIGFQYFVYIQQTAQNLQSWKLGVSLLGVNTFLAEDEYPNKVIIHIQTTSLPTNFVSDLNEYIKKILPLEVTFEVELNPDFSIFGFIIAIPDTYSDDPRLGYEYALSYNPDTLYDASALISPYNPFFITSYTLSPPSGEFPTTQPPFDITAEAVFTYNGVNYPLDVTDDSTYSSNNPSVISLDFNIATINDNGIAIITGNYIDQRAQVTYNVQNDNWVLGDSYLGLDTFLG